MSRTAMVKTLDETGEKHDLQFFYDAYTKYIALSAYLFGSASPIYDVNEMSPRNKFYKDARDVAQQLEIDWKTMSHEESNRIMLALLEDYYTAMSKVGNSDQLEIETTLKIAQNKRNNHEQR